MSDRMELEPSSNVALPPADRRRLVPEPLPVRLLTVDDATLITLAGLEVRLDAFYIDLLKFARDTNAGHDLIYRADNFRLKFDVVETLPERPALRPLVIEVPRLSSIEFELIEREIEYTRQRGVMPGEDRLVLQDPAGNWIEIVECRGV